MINHEPLTNALNSAITGVTSNIQPNTNGLYFVEELVSFRNVYIVRAEKAGWAMDTVVCDAPEKCFQYHIGSDIITAYKVRDDAHIVEIMNQTEQPNMTLEEFTANRDKWMRMVTEPRK
jgi:hypothetical protein